MTPPPTPTRLPNSPAANPTTGANLHRRTAQLRVLPRDELDLLAIR